MMFREMELQWLQYRKLLLKIFVFFSSVSAKPLDSLTQKNYIFRFHSHNSNYPTKTTVHKS